MKDYDARLQELRAQIAEKKRLEKLQSELRRQKKILQQSLQAREKELTAERANVDELERFSLAAVYYRITGRLNEKLSSEQQEAYTAAIKYEAAQKELAAVEQQLQSCDSALIPLFSCDVWYEQTLKEKMQAMKEARSAEAEAAFATEQQVTDLECKIKELSEALRAGKEAQKQARNALSELDRASGWNTWDIFGGGGVITHVAKYEHLDEAQAKIYVLQDALNRFRAELTDVTVTATFEVNVDSFLRFADFFFDGLIADWAVGGRIENARSQVSRILQQLQSVMKNLEQMELTAQKELEKNNELLHSQLLRRSD